MTRTMDIAWAAGFLEGEGSFCYHGGTTCAVRAAQVQKEPLERLQKLFGGRIALRRRNRSGGRNKNTKDIWHWWVYGQKAASIIMTVFVFLSPKRQEQASYALRMWRQPWGLDGRKKPLVN